MKRLLASIALTGLVMVPLSVFAHETQEFHIGAKHYSFVIGSLNEPVAVDDKSGVELTVSELPVEGAEKAEHVDESQPHEHAPEAPVTGLEQTLKVEISAAGKKKEMALTTVYGKPGSYKAVFIPTVQTTLTYRLFGTINNLPVDLSFSCNPAGHPATPEDKAETKISDQVTRVLKKGAFGCPAAKADLGFPEPSATIQELKASDGPEPLSIAALAIGALGLVVGVSARMRKVY